MTSRTTFITKRGGRGREKKEKDTLLESRAGLVKPTRKSETKGRVLGQADAWSLAWMSLDLLEAADSQPTAGAKQGPREAASSYKAGPMNSSSLAYQLSIPSPRLLSLTHAQAHAHDCTQFWLDFKEEGGCGDKEEWRHIPHRVRSLRSRKLRFLPP